MPRVMRKTIILTLLSTTSVGTLGAMSSLDALSMIESGDNDQAVGTAGEVSRFQIRPHIWRRFSRDSNYRNAEAAREVAGKFLAELEQDFRKRSGREPTDFDRYVLWNAGATYYARIGFSPTRVARTIRERATRFRNLCQLTVPVPDQPVVVVAAAGVTSKPAARPSQNAPSSLASVRPSTANDTGPVTTGAQVITQLPGLQLELPGFNPEPKTPGPGNSATAFTPLARPQQGVLALGGIGLP